MSRRKKGGFEHTHRQKLVLIVVSTWFIVHNTPRCLDVLVHTYSQEMVVLVNYGLFQSVKVWKNISYDAIFLASYLWNFFFIVFIFVICTFWYFVHISLTSQKFLLDLTQLMYAKGGRDYWETWLSRGDNLIVVSNHQTGTRSNFVILFDLKSINAVFIKLSFYLFVGLC